MPILIDLIRISGFRGINNLELSLLKTTLLIGPNNSGKTSVIKALQLALGDYSRATSEEDFFIDEKESRANEIIIDIRIVPIDENGERVTEFDAAWQTEFGDKIKAEANGYQFLAIRTRSKPELIKGGFDTSRSTLEIWPAWSNWNTIKIKETKLGMRFKSLPFISVEAQRDISQDLRERASFIGKILAGIEYEKSDVDNIERMIAEVNQEAVGKSKDLKSLKTHLESMNNSIGKAGGAEVTPFPKKLRDLSKNFTVHFGETDSNSFSMEYHGMGTRSWASMLTVKSFIELLSNRHAEESEPIFPILAAEEPEAHLHPNAQKTLFGQLSEINGQIIISTHSPYLTAMAELTQIRSLIKNHTGIKTFSIIGKLTDEDKKVIAREVIFKRGELLFAKCLLLCEGVTEEQVLPAMFEIYHKVSPWDSGVTCVSVGGKNYRPFVHMSNSLGIPACILSDNDKQTKNEVEAQMRRLAKDTGLPLSSDLYCAHYLNPGNDFEAEIIEHGLREEVIDALVLCATNGSSNTRFRQAKYREFNKLTDPEITEKMRGEKAGYSGFLSDILMENPRKKSTSELIPPSIRASLDCLKGWL